MANLKLPTFSKAKYNILEAIVLILETNPGARLTPEEINNCFNHPQMESHLNRKGAKDPVGSIIWCYKTKEGKFPELDFNDTHFYLVDARKNTSTKNMFVERPQFTSNPVNMPDKRVRDTSNQEKTFMLEKRFNNNSNANFINEDFLEKNAVVMGVAVILLVLAFIFNWGGIRHITFRIAVIAGTLFIGYKIITAKNTGFNLVGRIIFAIILLMSVFTVI